MTTVATLCAAYKVPEDEQRTAMAHLSVSDDQGVGEVLGSVQPLDILQDCGD
jgi:hypothetical protein